MRATPTLLHVDWNATKQGAFTTLVDEHGNRYAVRDEELRAWPLGVATALDEPVVEEASLEFDPLDPRREPPSATPPPPPTEADTDEILAGEQGTPLPPPKRPPPGTRPAPRRKK